MLTIIGIPLGLASFKIIPISLVPLGVQIVPADEPSAQLHLTWPGAGSVPYARLSEDLRHCATNLGLMWRNVGLMCRNIKILRAPYAVGVTDDDVHAAALQYVRTVGGVRLPGPHIEEAFNQAVETISAATRDLLACLEVSAEQAGGLAQAPDHTRARPGGHAVGVRSASPRSSSPMETSRITNFCTFRSPSSGSPR